MNTCAWCSKSVDHHKTIWVRKNLLIGYPFCSNRCSAQWKQNKSNEEAKKQEVNESNHFKSDPIVEDHVVSQEPSMSFEDVLAEARMMNTHHQIEKQKQEAKQEAIDKSNKEFFDSLKNNWKIVGIVAIILVIGFIYFVYNNKISKENDIMVSQQLEQIEDKVRLAIQTGDKEKALDLTNKLIHPSHKDMESQKFDTWHGYPKYDEYWSKKREKYKEQIINLK